MKSLKYTLLECSGLTQVLVNSATVRLSVFDEALMNSVWSCPTESVEIFNRFIGFFELRLNDPLKSLYAVHNAVINNKTPMF